MALSITRENLHESTDVDALWQAFLQANEDGDADLAAELRARMAQLSQERQHAEMSDEQLQAHIDGLRKRIDDEDPADAAKHAAELESLLDEAARRSL